MGRAEQPRGETHLPVAAVRAALLDWYRRSRRPLPWRDARDPYRILVAEVMLQQTRVEQALPYFETFLRRFPTAADLASATPEQVLATWQGLGYYRRALQLHAAARAVVERHGGRIPDDPDALRRLPGVGAYTAGAVLSIAFGRPVPALDGNAVRVLARLVAEPGYVDAAAVRRRLHRLAAELVDPADPGAFNQALMELGATVCRPRRPRCPDCPLAFACAARAAGRAEELPHRRPRAPVRVVPRVAALVRDAGGRVLLARRPPAALLGGLWELPAVEGAEPAALAAAAGAWGWPLRVEEPVGRLELVFSHRVWRLLVTRGRWLGEEDVPPPEGSGYAALAWADRDQLSRYPMPAGLHRWLVRELAGKSW